MGSDDILQGISSLIIIFITFFFILPRLVEATGVDFPFSNILLVILAFGIVGATISSILRR